MIPFRVNPRSTTASCRAWLLVPLWLVSVQLAACASHPPVPLDPDEILESLQVDRGVPAGSISSLQAAEARLAEASPRLRAARAAVLAAERLAGTATPLPNPEVSAAALLLRDSGITGSDRLGTEFGLGWTIWLDDRRAQEQELRRARVEEARAELAAAETRERIALRAAWWELAWSESALDTAEQQVRLADRSIEYSRQRIESGVATGLELRELELERARAETERLARRLAVVEARAEVAASLALRAEAISATPTAEERFIAPDAGALIDSLPETPDARRLELAYRTSELELALEITRQTPGLGFGLSKEREEGVSTWTLGPSIELPLFDRNQLGIAEALGHRERARVDYESALTERIGSIEAATERLKLRREQVELVKRKALPLAKEVVRLAERAMADGLDSSLRYLEALRGERALALDLIEAERELRAAWSALEVAAGRPLEIAPEPAGSLATPKEVAR